MKVGPKTRAALGSLAVVLALTLALMFSLYPKALQRSRETLLKQNLFTLRTVIDEYTRDKQAAQARLEDLVAQGYLRSVPVDPATGSSRTWRVVRESAESAVDPAHPGIWDVLSGSNDVSREGTPYKEW